MPRTAKAKVKKYVMTRTMHLGYIKQTLRAGTIIEHDEAKGTLKIEGQTYENTNDLTILKNHDWAEPYSAKKAKEYKEQAVQEEKAKEENIPEEKKEKPKKMSVVNSDIDEHDTIDISHTKKANRDAAKQAEQEALKPKEVQGMEIIKGDETLEERVRRLQTSIPKMPVVADDSLGEVSGTPLNAGTVQTKTAEEHAAAREEALAKTGNDASEKKAATKRAVPKKARKLPDADVEKL